MKKLANLLIPAIYSFLVAFGMIAAVPVTVNAQTSSKATTTKTAAAEKVYDYVAQPKDSYSKLARKAIQTYGINNKVSLSKAKIIAAETWLTKDAGSPYLQAGQKVSLKQSSVKSAVDKAAKLSKAKEALWAAYTAGVNFDTSHVGQAK